MALKLKGCALRLYAGFSGLRERVWPRLLDEVALLASIWLQDEVSHFWATAYENNPSQTGFPNTSPSVIGQKKS